jgi:hypothetical protein
VTKNLNQATKNRIKELIIQIVKKEKPETQKQLITLLQERHAIPQEQTTSLFIELENENRLNFTKPKPTTPASAKEYIFSAKAVWYWATITIAIATAIMVFSIPDTAYPIVYLRWALGTIFILFLPGFTFIKALFPAKVPIKTSSENMDTIEPVMLSFGMSLALVPMVGLILNYTPWGIRLTPITFSLLALTIVFATAAVLREYKVKAKVVYSD